MRHWLPASTLGRGAAPAPNLTGSAMGAMVHQLGDTGFACGMLQELAPVLPAASWSVYRTGRHCKPTLFMSASHGIPDTTQDCWWAYLSGPYRTDRTWGDAATVAPSTRLCHLAASDVGGEHQSRVYEAHGMAERVSIVEHENDGSVFAVNFYRHQHQRPFQDRQISDFEDMAPVLLALTRKHIALALRPGALQPTLPATTFAEQPQRSHSLPALRERLLRAHHGLTERELDVCARLLQGMTQEGIACDLGLSLPTVKTYRNRAFGRLGIHFRNELFALALGTQRSA
ncbi:regulatory LuxR family protein [Acidovorax sp. 69]|uniref:helix-turn-helix domain-containing protein n=1 Tax=Acidovorax sp. 69 TaxID=2035202 RepID=UPI000CB9164E|nr:helix-turn-helix transcriptional regulator [Acidovorax sp. 69]PJI97634.1 regulatory LuxR family protein [Acidovorax sp. 69]